MTIRFRPCIVIPTFDNPLTVESVVAAARESVPDVIVIDDGSGPAGRDAVRRLADVPGVTTHRRESNGGKGAAVRDGLRLADELGFTHAVQVDADGQHDLDDIPRFLATAEARPEALIAGTPIFDDSAPLSRVLGRKLSRFWTRVETHGRRVIDDPLCGFRVYPVAAALRARARGCRMDFDPEIAVRMVWDAVPVVNLPTRVRYLSPGDGGVSHFRMVRDNLRITAMHTRLVLGAVVRLVARP